MGLLYGRLNNQEILNERRIITGKDDNICITIDGNGITDRGFINDPYFKVYSSKNPNKKGTKVARIKLKEPEYIIHNNQKWDMNNKELKILDEYLDKIVTVNGKEITVWEYIKQSAIDESELDNSKLSKEEKDKIRSEILDLKKPDYSLLRR